MNRFEKSSYPKKGDQFERWTVLEDSTHLYEYILCRCACGTEKKVRAGNLKKGTSRSCGCTRRGWRQNSQEPYIKAGFRGGKLTALEDGVRCDSQIMCRCDCGKERLFRASNVKTKHSQSCGCETIIRSHKAISVAVTTHGMSRHPLYHTWNAIISRTTDPSSEGYQWYGARGIKVHPEWCDDPRPFIEWIETNLGAKPKGHSLDRIDNDSDYVPGNLRWATFSEQSRNRRSIGKLTAERDSLQFRLEIIYGQLMELSAYLRVMPSPATEILSKLLQDILKLSQEPRNLAPHPNRGCQVNCLNCRHAFAIPNVKCYIPQRVS